MKTYLKRPVVVSVSESEADKLWGIHQFPKMWEDKNNIIYLRINKGEDSYGLIGEQYEGLYYLSNDKGVTWKKTKVNQERKTIIFSNEEEIFLNYRSKRISNEISSIETVQSINEMAQFNIYSLNDFKQIEIYRRKANDTEFVKEEGIITSSDLYISVLSGSRLDRKQPYKSINLEYTNDVIKNRYNCIVIDKDDNLYTVIQSSEPYKGHVFYSAHCLCSKDRGQSWERISTICNDHDLTKWGTAGDEQEIIITDTGRLICVLRTEACIYGSYEDTDSASIVYYSDDKGKSWSKPIFAADSSVTPHLVQLGNGIIALVHGRPGVHVCFSSDDGESWSESIKIVGYTTKEALNKSNKLGIDYNGFIYSDRICTCANTSVASIDKNSFLLAYSDFKHINQKGEEKKAIKVVRVVTKTKKHNEKSFIDEI